MKMHNTVASTSIPLRVDYLCCFCGSENSDGNQLVALRAQSHGSIAPSLKLDSEARERLMEKAGSIVQDVGEGKYRSAYLTCTCKSCGKRQPWANYIRMPIWSIVLFVLGILMMLFSIINMYRIIISSRLLILPLMLVPFIAIAALNALTSLRVARLNTKYLPRITVPKGWKRDMPKRSPLVNSPDEKKQNLLREILKNQEHTRQIVQFTYDGSEVRDPDLSVYRYRLLGLMAFWPMAEQKDMDIDYTWVYLCKKADDDPVLITESYDPSVLDHPNTDNVSRKKPRDLTEVSLTQEEYLRCMESVKPLGQEEISLPITLNLEKPPV